jgi:hypothetical protein
MGSRPWPRNPTQQEYDRLVSLADSQWLGLVADLSDVTFEVVLHNAMVSVPLLEVLGDGVVNTFGLGIDRFGRLRHIPPGGQDYRGTFCTLVARIEQKLAREMAFQALVMGLRDKLNLFLQRTALNDNSGVGDQDRQLSEVRVLRKEIRKELSRPGIKVRHVDAVLSKTRPAMVELHKMGVLSVGVLEDLRDRRRPDRWDELVEMRRSLGLAPADMESARQVDIREIGTLIERDMEFYTYLAERITGLKGDLDIARAELLDLGRI